MTDLNEDSLEQAIKQVKALANDGAIALRPKHLIMVPYPEESVDEFVLRVEQAREVVRNLQKE